MSASCARHGETCAPPSASSSAGSRWRLRSASRWGLPGTSTWAVDSISPRSCGLGAIVETYWPGHFHTYPALHMGLLTILSLPWLALAALRVGVGARRPRRGADQAALHDGHRGERPPGRRGDGPRDCLEHDPVVDADRGARGRHRRRAPSSPRTRRSSTTRTPATSRSRTSSGRAGRWSRWTASSAASRAKSRAILCSVAAVLSKDQAAGALLLPLAVALVVAPGRRDASRLSGARW